MLSLRRPSDAEARAYLEAQAELDLTYDGVGTSNGTPPPGYRVDHNRVRLGEGEATYHAAVAALNAWDQFRLGWVEPWPPDATIREGEVVASLARLLGVFWLNPTRIVYVVEDERGPVARYSFANGTLPGHPETGEERFLIEWDRSSGAVWYDILAFARPYLLAARVGYPYMRHVQRRFAAGSLAAMVRAVAVRAGR